MKSEIIEDSSRIIYENLKITDETTKRVVREILSVIHQTYKSPPVKNYFEPNASSHALLPGLGLSPVDLIQVYDGEDHFAFLTMFFGPKGGYELSYKVRKEKGLEFDRYKDLVQHIACSILSGDMYVDLFFESICLLKDEYRSDTTAAVLILDDPTLEYQRISIGGLSYKLIFGISEETYAALANEDGGIQPEPMRRFYDNEIKENPNLISMP